MPRTPYQPLVGLCDVDFDGGVSFILHDLYIFCILSGMKMLDLELIPNDTFPASLKCMKSVGRYSYDDNNI